MEADAVETPVPEMDMEDAEAPMDSGATVLSAPEPAPEPEPVPEDMTDGEQFNVEEPEPVEQMEEEEDPQPPTKKELKAIEKYNAAVDNVVKILSERLTGSDALPL